MQMKKRKTLVLSLLLALVLAMTAILPGCSEKTQAAEQQKESTAIYIETQNPERGNIVLTNEFIGKVEPEQHVTVYPKIPGEILALNYNIGDTVEAGSVLMEVDARDLKYSIAQTKAAINSAEAQLGLGVEMAEAERENFHTGLDSGTNPEIIKAEAEVRAAEVAVDGANTELRVLRRNYRDAKNGEGDYGFMTDGQIDALRDQISGAEIKLEGAQLQLETAEEALRAVQKALADGEITYDQSVEMAELNANLEEKYIALESLNATLGDASVKAPIGGTIEFRYVDVHDMVAPQVPAYVISNKDMMSVSFAVPESALEHIQPGDSVTLEKSGTETKAVVTEVSNMVVGGLYPIKVTVNDPNFVLNTGSMVKILADTQKAMNTILAPMDAINFEDGEAFVFVYDNGVAQKRLVETGLSDSENIEIVSGLSTTDELITTWNSNLEDGVEVLLPGEKAGEDLVEPVEDISSEQDSEDAEDSNLENPEDRGA